MISEQKTRVVWEAIMQAFSRFEVKSLGFESCVFGGSLSMDAFCTIDKADGVEIVSVLASPMGSSFFKLIWYPVAALLTSLTSLMDICLSKAPAFSSLGLGIAAKQKNVKWIPSSKITKNQSDFSFDIIVHIDQTELFTSKR